MPRPRLARLELQILEILWARQNASIREVQEAFPEPRPAYTTIQTTVYRLEAKRAVRRVRKISNAHIFEPLIAREDARRRLLNEVLSFFGGRALPMMAQLVEAGKLTRDDLRDLERRIEAHEKQERRDKPDKSDRAARADKADKLDEPSRAAQPRDDAEEAAARKRRRPARSRR